MGIDIPAVFSACNLQLANGRAAEAKQAYAAATANGGKAGDCVGCKQCEEACPQHLPITELLRKAAETLE